MITLHVLKLLEDNGFGTIGITGSEPNADLFFEKLTLDKNGLYITSRGAQLAKGLRRTQAFDIYARGANDVEGAQKLEQVLEFFTLNQDCELPIVTGISTTEYKNVSITPTSNIENVGLDDNNRIIYVVSAEIRFNKGVN